MPRASSRRGIWRFLVRRDLGRLFQLFVDPASTPCSSAKERRRRLWSDKFFCNDTHHEGRHHRASVVVIVAIAPLFSTLPGAKALLPFVALIIIFDSTRAFIVSLFDAEEKMQWDAAAFIAANVSIAIFGFIFLLKSPTPSLSRARMSRELLLARLWLSGSANRFRECSKARP